MATKVDELVVEIKGDIKDLIKKLDQVSDKTKSTSKEMKGSFGGISQFIKGLSPAMKALGAGAAVATAAFLALNKAMEKVNEIVGQDRLAKRIRIGTERFQELSYAARTVGVDSETFADAIKDLNVKITDASLGAQAYEDALNAIGLKSKDLVQLSPEEQFLAFSEAVSKANKELGDFAADEINDSMYRLVPLMRQGKDGINALTKEARDLGIVVSSKEMQGFQELNKTFVQVKAGMAGFTNEILIRLTPTLKGVLEIAKSVNYEIARMGRTSEDNARIAKDAIEPLHKMKSALEEEHAALQEIIKSMIGVKAQDGDFQGHLKATQIRAREVAQALDDVNQKLIALNSIGPIQGPDQDQGGGLGLLGQEILENQPITTVPEQGLLESELERMQEFYTSLEEAEAESWERRKILESQALADSIMRIREKEEAEKKLKQETEKAKYDITKSALGNLASLMNTESRKAFEVGKAASIAEASMAMYESAVHSFNFGSKIGGPPVGAAFAATAIAAGLNNINNIRNTNFGSAGGGAASTGGAPGLGGGAGAEATTVQNVTEATINVSGSNFVASDITGLVEELKGFQRDGGQLIIK